MQSCGGDPYHQPYVTPRLIILHIFDPLHAPLGNSKKSPNSRLQKHGSMHAVICEATSQDSHPLAKGRLKKTEAFHWATAPPPKCVLLVAMDLENLPFPPMRALPEK